MSGDFPNSDDIAQAFQTCDLQDLLSVLIRNPLKDWASFFSNAFSATALNSLDEVKQINLIIFYIEYLCKEELYSLALDMLVLVFREKEIFKNKIKFQPSNIFDAIIKNNNVEHQYSLLYLLEFVFSRRPQWPEDSTLLSHLFMLYLHLLACAHQDKKQPETSLSFFINNVKKFDTLTIRTRLSEYFKPNRTDNKYSLTSYRKHLSQLESLEQVFRLLIPNGWISFFSKNVDMQFCLFIYYIERENFNAAYKLGHNNREMKTYYESIPSRDNTEDDSLLLNLVIRFILGCIPESNLFQDFLLQIHIKNPKISLVLFNVFMNNHLYILEKTLWLSGKEYVAIRGFFETLSVDEKIPYANFFANYSSLSNSFRSSGTSDPTVESANFTSEIMKEDERANHDYAL